MEKRWKVQDGGEMEAPGIWECCVSACVPSESEYSNSVQEYQQENWSIFSPGRQ